MDLCYEPALALNKPHTVSEKGSKKSVSGQDTRNASSDCQCFMSLSHLKLKL